MLTISALGKNRGFSIMFYRTKPCALACGFAAFGRSLSLSKWRIQGFNIQKFKDSTFYDFTHTDKTDKTFSDGCSGSRNCGLPPEMRGCALVASGTVLCGSCKFWPEIPKRPTDKRTNCSSTIINLIINKFIKIKTYKMKQQQKIALKGQEYASPRTESVEVRNQGVLCSSAAGNGGGGRGSFGIGVGKGGLS